MLLLEILTTMTDFSKDHNDWHTGTTTTDLSRDHDTSTETMKIDVSRDHDDRHNDDIRTEKMKTYVSRNHDDWHSEITTTVISKDHDDRSMQTMTADLHRVTTLQTIWNYPTFLWRFTALGMLSVTHIMPVLVILSVVGVEMQQYMIWNHILNT